MLEQYKTKEASEAFTRALELKPGLLIARINLSIALYYLPDAEGAKREAQEAVTQDENALQPYLLGLIARSQNRFEEALVEFQNVLKSDSADVGANINVGQILVQQKKYEEAIGAFRRALEAEPYNETALYNLGLLLTRTGKRDEGQQESLAGQSSCWSRPPFRSASLAPNRPSATHNYPLSSSRLFDSHELL